MPHKYLVGKGYPFYNNITTNFTYDGKGEIVALTDAVGNVVANYHYDAWGRNLGVTDANGNAITSSTHIGLINPIRYKGYYYDSETGLYYLNSRYYDPEVCRFISADDVGLLGITGDLLSYNLFAYCKNNPVQNIDSSGKVALPMVFAHVVVSGLVNAATSLIAAYITGQEFTVWDFAIAGLAGAVGSTPNSAVAILLSGAISGVYTFVTADDNLSTGQKGACAALAAVTTMMTINGYGRFSKVPLSRPNTLKELVVGAIQDTIFAVGSNSIGAATIRGIKQQTLQTNTSPNNSPKGLLTYRMPSKGTRSSVNNRFINVPQYV